MAQADGSRQSLAYVKEVTFGVTPATPAFKPLRHNSNTLSLSRAAFQSQELRADREIADFRLGTRAGEGNVVGELSMTTYDDLLEAALCGTWNANVLKAGVLRSSFTMERYFEDVVQYQRFKGVQIDTLQVGFNTGSIVPITFGLWAQDQDAWDDEEIADATYTAPTTTSPMDALTGEVLEGGVAIGVVTEATLNLANNLNPRYVIGSDKSLAPSIGRRNVTGSITAFFENATLLNKFLLEQTSSLRLDAKAGVQVYQFLIPKLKYTGGDLPVAGEGPISVTMPFQGLLDPVLGTSLQITRVPA
jgi:hypothetical protein